MEFDPEILRKYEEGKLKWYFAVVECDSVETAEHLYKECGKSSSPHHHDPHLILTFPS